MTKENELKKDTAVQSAKARAKKRGRVLLVVYSVVLLCVIISAVLLCIFVFFKVSDIKVNGSTVYSREEIISVLGISSGDNLVFAKTQEAEDVLKSEFPYIENVKISKKIPSTIEVNISEAEVYYSFKYSGRYVYISRTGKMLEANDVPMDGSILVTGGEVKDENGKLKFTDPKVNEAFLEISNLFLEHEKGDITEIDLTNIHDIFVVYDGRVKLKLGNASDLTYKLNFGLQIVNNSGIKEDEKGSLDLSMSKSINKAYFTPEISSSADSAPKDAPKDAPTDEAGGETEGENTEASDSSEGQDIPENVDTDETPSEGENVDNSKPNEDETPSRGSDIPDI